MNLAKTHCKLTDGEAGVMRTTDSLRDAEQHWMLHTRRRCSTSMLVVS